MFLFTIVFNFGQYTPLDVGITDLFDWGLESVDRVKLLLCVEVLVDLCNVTFGGVSGLADSCVVVEVVVG